MGEPGNLAEIGQRLEQRFGVNRSLLMGVGLACVLPGVIAMALPSRLFGSLIRLLGVLPLLGGEKAGKGKGTSSIASSLTPKPLAWGRLTCMSPRLLPLERSISVMSLFPPPRFLRAANAKAASVTGSTSRERRHGSDARARARLSVFLEAGNLGKPGR